MKFNKNKLDWKKHFSLKEVIALVLILVLFLCLSIKIANLGPDSESTPNRQGLSILEETFADGWSLITGADIAIPVIENETVNDSAEGDNQPPEIDLPIDNSSIEEPAVDEMNETIEDDDNQTGEGLVENQNLATQADCAVWPCNCGDTITGSITMNSSLTGCNGLYGVIIDANNIIFDCNNSQISGNGVKNVGIDVNGNNVTIKNCNITQFYEGIDISSTNCNITNNRFFNNQLHGIYLTGSNTKIFQNKIYNNSRGIGITSSNNYIDSNNISNNSFYGISFSGTSQGNNITNNNITSNTYGIHSASTALSAGTNITFNNFNNNKYSINYTAGSRLEIENNWWGFTDCYNISQNISGDGYVDFNPFLNNPYPNGSSTDCPDQYCGMILFTSKNLTNNINSCSVKGVKIHANSVVLDCQGYSISGESGNNEEGIYIITSQKNQIIKNCRVSSFKKGVFISDDSYDIRIINDTFSNTQIGIDLNNSWAGLIANNTILGNSSSYNSTIGIYLSNSNSLIKNNISYLSIAIHLNSSSGSNLTDNYLFNNSIGYQLVSQGNTFSLEKSENNIYGILINSSSTNIYNNIFRDCLFINNTFDLNLIESTNSNLTFINSSINKTKLYVYAGGKAYVKWYVDVNVTVPGANPLENVTINAYNSLGNLEYTNSTDSNGISRLILSEFYRTNEINYYLVPHTVIANKSNYIKNSTSVNLYNKTYAQANLSLIEFICGSTIYNDLDLSGNYHCKNIGVIIGKNNLTLNGNNYNLTGNGLGMGINITSKINISILNLRIDNFTEGIFFLNTNYSNSSSLIIINNTKGIVFNNSNYNKIYESIIANNSEYSVLATNESINNSLINTSIDLNNVTIIGTANIFIKKYIFLNAIRGYGKEGEGIALSDADVYGYYNNSGALDYFTITNSSGIARLILTESNKNITGITYFTPHNITLLYILRNGNMFNSTIINISLTNNITLLLIPNCSRLSQNNVINNDTALCPGTFSISYLDINRSNVILTCDNTIIQSYIPSPRSECCQMYTASIEEGGLVINNKENITISGCVLKNFDKSVDIQNSYNISIINTSISSSNYGVYCTSSTKLIINGSYFSSSSIYLYNCNNSQITNNYLYGDSAYVYNSYNNILRNNTFSSSTKGIIFSSNYPSNNNTVYYNIFSSNYYNIYYFNASNTNYQNTFNTSLNNYAQGNQYSDYCDMGSDLNNDGYADNISSATANDWPYSENITTKIYDPTVNNAGVVDYGPKITSCPEEEVFLTTRGGVTAVVAAPAVAAEAPPAKPEGKVTVKEKIPESIEISAVEETKKYLETKTTEIKTIEKVTKVKVVLENTGTKKMQLFPQLFQEAEETFFIITKKTLGFEGSSLSSLAGLAYSQDKIAGRLLKAEILDPEQIVLNPGERIEKTLEIKEGLIAPRQIKIQFTTLGEVVKEQEVQIEQKALSGTAVDVDSEKALIDVYALILPQQLTKQLEEKSNGGITGAAVAEISAEPSSPYFLELSLNSREGKKTYFSDLYGPYQLKKEQVFVFAQQLKYDPAIYAGTYLVKTRIFQGEKSIVENKFEVDLGKEKPLVGYAAWPGFKGKAISLSWLWLSLAVLLFICFTSFYAYHLLRRQAQPKKTFSKIVKIPPAKIRTESPFKIKEFLLKNERFLLISLLLLALITGIYILITYLIQDILSFILFLGGAIISLKFWLVPLIVLLIVISIIIYLLKKRKKEPPVKKLVLHPLPKKVIAVEKPEEKYKQKALELSQFILSCLKAGKSKAEIKELLVKNHWPERIVDDYLEELSFLSHNSNE